MQILHRIQDVREAVKTARAENSGLKVGFVPTMGYLHKGHASLLEAAREQSDLVVLSIFVNPLQFGPNEDLSRYPRDQERDLAVARAAGTDIVFFPSVEEMYPQPTKTVVSVSEVTERLCGAARPGHFDGVATVVTKLFNIVQPDQAYFGLKDAQQIAVIQQMVDDLNIPVGIVPCPIVREEDGLAMSSRNVYLQPEERKQALVLSSALQMAERLVQSDSGSLQAEELRQAVIDHIRQSPLADIDYADILAYPSLVPVTDLRSTPAFIIALAVKFGKTRLIDNIIIRK
ncbi:pantoate--beta-alanine ligase [Paenibacillus doosanensis]|uniref:pantoate--beta-alanine ligase n=1 Tax=Paenibacillus doosanensis TaxID=1229154 RepID=UPI00217FEBBB|nr:pantoate--beta-alanine ligase [Paenibacillus doosanensis]MCS7462507.1 pantoate--beta-alanine ligase [Paenibacillus doosanensis]